MKKQRWIAVIPARCGSKGLPDKNIRPLDGRPLLTYTVEAALKSGICDTVHVSTDSMAYADIAKAAGADVPFLRGAETATDTASTWDVVQFVLAQYEARGERFDAVALLQPTTPLRTAEDLVDACRLFDEREANAVVAVCEAEHPPLWMDTIPADGNMAGFVKKELRDVPRQQMPVYYRVNGAIYLIKKEVLAHIETLYDDRCFAYRMDKMHSVDIDDSLDFAFAEVLMRRRNQAENR